MGREIKRVPTSFDWPIDKVWSGFLMPDSLRETPCPDCGGTGYSSHARHLQDLWYGNARFRPEDNGSTALTPYDDAVREFAERNVTRAPDYYLRPTIDWTDPARHEADITRDRGMTGAARRDAAIHREAMRLADHWNNSWSHHLNADDVAALLDADRLWDFTHTCRKGEGWRRIEPRPTPTPEQVNEWSLRGFGHDGINAMVCVRARCKREGQPETCGACGGHGSAETYPGQRAESDAWTRSDPPAGDGWQLWETVSEGSPVSPVFATADELAAWMSDPARGGRWVPRDVAAKFIAEGWAPSFIDTPETGFVSGVEFVGTER